MSCFARGAAGVAYLLDDRVGDLETLVNAIREVHAGDTLLDPSVVNALVRRRNIPALDVLSLRELDVLAAIAQGHTKDEIANKLSVSRKAVERSRHQHLRQLPLPDPKRFDRRVTAALSYLHAYGDWGVPFGRPESTRRVGLVVGSV